MSTGFEDEGDEGVVRAAAADADPPDSPSRDEAPAAPSPAPPPAAWSQLWRWALRLTPWASLGFSVAGAVWMERDRDHAAGVALVVAGSWLATSALLWWRRRQFDSQRVLAKAVDFAGVAATQSLAQLPLFFSAPFYLLAFAWTPLQTLFLFAFAAVVAVVSWDPLAERLLTDRHSGPPLLAFGGFVGLRVTLCMLGLPSPWALAASLLAVCAGLVWDLQLRWPDTRAPQRWAMAVAITVTLGGLSPAMPAAPLQLVDAGLGTGVQGHVLSGRATTFAPGTKLWCWTAVFAPRELHEVLLHRWSRDGAELAELELDVDGGRQQGFRTWSRLRAHAPGTYTCEVRTRVGQSLGEVTAVVGAARAR